MKRTAQGAIEYLFMIAAALIIVLVVWRYLQNRGNKAGQIQQEAENQIASGMESVISSTPSTAGSA